MKALNDVGQLEVEILRHDRYPDGLDASMGYKEDESDFHKRQEQRDKLAPRDRAHRQVEELERQLTEKLGAKELRLQVGLARAMDEFRPEHRR